MSCTIRNQNCLETVHTDSEGPRGGGGMFYSLDWSIYIHDSPTCQSCAESPQRRRHISPLFIVLPTAMLLSIITFTMHQTLRYRLHDEKTKGTHVRQNQKQLGTPKATYISYSLKGCGSGGGSQPGKGCRLWSDRWRAVAIVPRDG